MEYLFDRLQEYKNANMKIQLNNSKFDYIITHSAPISIQNLIASNYENNELTMFLENVKNKATYNKWFFGHYHQDKIVDEKHIAVFNSLIKIN